MEITLIFITTMNRKYAIKKFRYKARVKGKEGSGEKRKARKEEIIKRKRPETPPVFVKVKRFGMCEFISAASTAGQGVSSVHR